MKVARLSLVLGALALLGATPALAENVAPSRLNNKRAEFKLYNLMSPADRGRAMMLAFSQCLIRDNLPAVRKAVAFFPDTPEADKQLRKVATDECLVGETEGGGELSFSFRLARGALFQALYLNKFAKAAPVLPAEPLVLESETVGQDPEAARNYIGLRRFTECVGRTDPAVSRAILLPPVGSKEEGEAYKALAPLLGPCLPEGMKISFSKSILGGLIAEVMYRLSTQAPSASVAGKY